MFKHLLVPTDGSVLSSEAIKHAIAFAKEVGARLTFFYAKPGFPVAFYSTMALTDPKAPEIFAQMAAKEAQQILDAAAQEASAAGVANTSLTVVSDIPYQAIIEASNALGCDLIFMASHGRHGISGLLLGSETQKVLTHSKIPVLVYR